MLLLGYIVIAELLPCIMFQRQPIRTTFLRCSKSTFTRALLPQLCTRLWFGTQLRLEQNHRLVQYNLWALLMHSFVSSILYISIHTSTVLFTRKWQVNLVKLYLLSNLSSHACQQEAQIKEQEDQRKEIERLHCM